MNMSANVRIAIVMGLVVVLPVVVISLMVQSLVAPQAALQHAFEQRRRAQYEAAQRSAAQERQLTMQRERERAQQAERERLEHEARESAPRTVRTLVAMGDEGMGGFTKIKGLPKCNYRYEITISGFALYMDIKYDNGTTRRFPKPDNYGFKSYTIGPFGPPYPVAVNSVPQELDIKVFDIERPCKERRKT